MRFMNFGDKQCALNIEILSLSELQIHKMRWIHMELLAV